MVESNEIFVSCLLTSYILHTTFVKIGLVALEKKNVSSRRTTTDAISSLSKNVTFLFRLLFNITISN